jgi:hypothetical protein
MAVAALGFAALAQAAPLDPKQVAAEAKWVVEVDVDALVASSVVKDLYEKCTAKTPAAGKFFDKVKAQTGLDLRKDVHSVTLYGPGGDHKGVMLVNAAFDQKLLEEKAKAAPDYTSSTYGSYQLSSFTKKIHGKKRPVTAAFWKPEVLVFAGSVDEVKSALDVLDGKQPGLSAGAPLAAEAAAGTIVLARAIDLSGAYCPVLKQSESLNLAVGENAGESFFAGKLVTKAPETAEQVKQVVEGFRALGLLRHGDDPEALKLVNLLNVKVADKTVEVEFHAPAADVAKQAEKAVEMHLKKAAEAHHRGHKEKKAAADKKAKCPADTCPADKKAAAAEKTTTPEKQ